MSNPKRKIDFEEVRQSWQAHFLSTHRCCNMGDMDCPNISEHLGIARFYAAYSSSKNLSLEEIDQIYAEKNFQIQESN